MIDLGKRLRSHHSLALQLTVSYSFLLLLILFISTYFYQVSKNDLQQTEESRTKAQLFNAVDVTDRDLSAMQGFALSFAHDMELGSLARANPDRSDDFFVKSYKMQQKLISYVPVERQLPIRSYFIYLPESDSVLTTGSFSEMNLFYIRKGLRKGHYGKWHDMILNEENYASLLPLSDYNPFNRDYLYLLSLDNYLFYRTPARLGFLINKNKMDQNFSVLFSQEDGFLAVLDSDHVLQYQKGKLPSKNFNPKKLTTLSYQNAVSSLSLPGAKQTVVRCISKNNKWEYYYVIPVSHMQNSLRPYQNMYLLITGVTLLVCFLLIYFLSIRNTRPYIRMGDELDSSLSRSRQLESTLERQEPVIRNSYIRNIMLNRISSPDEMDYIKRYLNLTRTDIAYFVLYIVAYPNNPEPEAENTNENGNPAAGESSFPPDSAYDARVLSCMKKYFGEPLYLYHPKKHNYAILLREEENRAHEERMASISGTFAAFHEEMLAEHETWTMAGMGTRDHILENIWKSYQQAMESASYTSGDLSFRDYNSLDLSSDIYYYPSQLSESLTEFITAGNKGQVREIFQFLYYENLEKRSLSYQKMQGLLLSVHSTLFRVRCMIPDGAEQVQTVDIHLAEYLSLKQLENTALSLCTYFEGITTQNQTILSMKAYIMENYRDSSLCLTKLSDQFNLSESYISYLFKESTGCNFSVYLKQIRMRKAHKLVTGSSLPLSELYREVGYNNSNSFRRAFKKAYGVSAKAMRDSLKSAGS